MSHSHDHGHHLPDHRGRLAIVLGLSLTVMAVEVVGAVASGSHALLADAGHMLTDVAGLSLGLVAAAFARRPPSDRRTWGYHRAEVLGAAAQAALLLAVGTVVIVEAVRRLLSTPEIASGSMLVFGAIGLAANLVGLFLLAGGRDANLNLRAAFLEVVNDALGSVAVIVAAVIIETTGWLRADAVASLVIGALIVPRTVALLRETVHVLMESTPRHLDLSRVRARMLTVAHVRSVHDLHATQVATGLPAVTAHVVVESSCFHDGHLGALLDEVQDHLATEFGVAHSTIQFEPHLHAEHERLVHA